MKYLLVGIGVVAVGWGIYLALAIRHAILLERSYRENVHRLNREAISQASKFGRVD